MIDVPSSASIVVTSCDRPLLGVMAVDMFEPPNAPAMAATKWPHEIERNEVQ